MKQGYSSLSLSIYLFNFPSLLNSSLPFPSNPLLPSTLPYTTSSPFFSHKLLLHIRTHSVLHSFFPSLYTYIVTPTFLLPFTSSHFISTPSSSPPLLLFSNSLLSSPVSLPSSSNSTLYKFLHLFSFLSFSSFFFSSLPSPFHSFPN